MCTQTTEAIDVGYLRQMIPDRPAEAVEFLEMIQQAYEASAGASLESIRGACRTLDLATLKKAAHSLKGACQSLGAKPMAKLLLELEHIGETVGWDSARALLSEIEQESTRVPAGLAAFRRALQTQA